jgi:hypothetical protein
VDFASLKSVQNAAKKFPDPSSRLDILFNKYLGLQNTSKEKPAVAETRVTDPLLSELTITAL